MSVFGGDSWGREAQYRKRRVDDLLTDNLNGSSSSSSYRKLSSGKYACLVCPHNPILDSPLMLSMHCKGSRHLAAESRLRERELRKQDEINKRIALDSAVRSNDATSSGKNVRSTSKPLIQQMKKATDEILCNKTPKQDSSDQNCDVRLSIGHVTNVTNHSSQISSHPEIIASEELLVQQQLDMRKQREKELKFTEAGWKRDGFGRWYRDENVEFDSDEEDPNICLG